MRGLQVRTILTLYEQFVPVGFIRLPAAPDPLLLDEDLTEAVANFRQKWTREGNCHEITLWHVLDILVKCKRDIAFLLIRAAAVSGHPTFLSGSMFLRTPDADSVEVNKRRRKQIMT